MNIWGCAIDDPRITEMDPVQKIWMYENWIADQLDKAELAKNHAYLLASFSHPDAVKQLMGGGTGGGYSSTDEEFEETTKMIKQINDKSDIKINKKKRRRIIKG